MAGSIDKEITPEDLATLFTGKRGPAEQLKAFTELWGNAAHYARTLQLLAHGLFQSGNLEPGSQAWLEAHSLYYSTLEVSTWFDQCGRQLAGLLEQPVSQETEQQATTMH